MRKSLSKTPAPKSDRIYGSKVNPKGSASSEKSASKIVLSDDIIDGLKNKLAEFKENHTNKNITLNDLKAVYRRGLGAYSKTHRPTISGGKPNTRNAWAMARVNKFLEKASGKKVKKAYVQDDDLLKYENGGELKSFYKWFSDWYKGFYDKMDIIISIPNEVSGLKSVPYKEENVMVIDMFRKIDPSIDAKPYLEEILNKADEYGVTLYLMPEPNYKYIKDVEYKNKISTKYLIDYYSKFGFELTPNKEFMKRLPKYKDGGEVDDHKETYKKWRSLVNMSYSELKKFYDSEEGKRAGLTPSEAKSQGIDSGRESARWILKMKKTPVSKWTPTMWKWANKQISFISRMSGNKGKLYDEKGNKTRKYLSLLIWGNNPEKKRDGGTLPDIRMEDTVGRIDDPRLADISYYKNGGEIIFFENTKFPKRFHIGELVYYKHSLKSSAEAMVLGKSNDKIKIKILHNYTPYSNVSDLSVGYFGKVTGRKGFVKEGYKKEVQEGTIKLVNPSNIENLKFVSKETLKGKAKSKEFKHYANDISYYKKGGQTKFHVKVNEGLSNETMNQMLRSSLEKLNWYKSKGWTKDKLIEGKKFTKAWLDKYYEEGGTINSNNKSNIMEQVKFNGLPHIDTINNGDSILIQEDVFSGNLDAPKHIGSRYIHCEVMGKGGMINSLNLKVVKSVGANPLRVGEVITRPIANVLTKGRKMIIEPITSAMPTFKEGGLNPDNKEVKQYFAHDSGNAGGVLVGKRHSEGGIKAINKGTGQPIEMEGGEVVITRGAVSNPKKYDFNGKEMTTREILSKLNVDGGGVSFAEGGDVPEKMNCGCNTYDFGGSTMSIQDFISRSDADYQNERLKMGIQKERNDHYTTLSRLNSGAITIEQALREIAQKEMKLDSKYPFGE